jgi:CBS-domain-containing membrane protein
LVALDRVVAEEERMADPLRVRDLMSHDVHTLGRNDEIAVADELMKMERIRHLPVVGEDGELAGVVSQRDLFRTALARMLGYGTSGQDRLMHLVLVKEVMSTPVETIGPDAPLSEAATRMIDMQVGCLVVVEGKRILGLLTEGDFVRHVAAAS